MTRYEYIVKNSKSEMAMVIAFCVAAYIERETKQDFSCEALIKFISEESEPIEKHKEKLHQQMVRATGEGTDDAFQL